MASFVKAQILKHLTRFFKNLAPEQLQLSTFKGSCELYNLELEERVLVDLLSFPSWLTISKAACNQLTIKISWTKMKSVPIQMNLDEVMVEMEVCEEFRDVTNSSLADLIGAQPPGKYGFSDRVIDGMTVTINNVLITFKSKIMSATFNLSRILLESRCPNWKQGELSLTRIKEPTRGQILLFKIIEWQTMRLEAKCLTDPNQAPLRLITNHAQCRITIKKRLEDCSVMSARLFVIFEDILWVLTFAQFITAASFIEYIFALIKRSPISKKTDVFESTPQHPASYSNANKPNVSPMHTSKQSKAILTGNMSSSSLLEQKFLCYDILETSLHLSVEKIDAHLYDDMDTSNLGGNSADGSSGGALQTTLDNIQVDCYPYSRAIGQRKHWYNWFDPSPTSRKHWLNSHFAEFDLKQRQGDLKTNASDGHERSNKVPTATNEQLLSLTVLVRLKDYCINCVATNETHRGAEITKFIHTDNEYHLPPEMPAIYLELDYFYYFPQTDANSRKMIYEDAPDPTAFIHLSPSKLLFDSPTVLFLNSFQANLSRALVRLNDVFLEETTSPKLHCRIEILMPQLSLPAKSNLGDQMTKTSNLLVKAGKLIITNSVYDKNVMSQLASGIEQLESSVKRGEQTTTFPWSQDHKDLSSNFVWNNAMLEYAMNQGSQLWVMQLDPVWMDFMNWDNNLATCNRLQAIVEPVKAFAFIHLDVVGKNKQTNSSRDTRASEPSQIVANHLLDDTSQTNQREAQEYDTVSILVTILDNPILANIDQTQFKFLQKFFIHLDKFLQRMKADALNIIKLDNLSNVFGLNLIALVYELKARVILSKESDKSGKKNDESSSSRNIDANPLLEVSSNSKSVSPAHSDAITNTLPSMHNYNSPSNYSSSTNPLEFVNHEVNTCESSVILGEDGQKYTKSNPFVKVSSLDAAMININSQPGSFETSRHQEFKKDSLDDLVMGRDHQTNASDLNLSDFHSTCLTIDGNFDDLLLDECTEVADEASNLLLGDYSSPSYVSNAISKGPADDLDSMTNRLSLNCSKDTPNTNKTQYDDYFRYISYIELSLRDLIITTSALDVDSSIALECSKISVKDFLEVPQDDYRTMGLSEYAHHHRQGSDSRMLFLGNTQSPDSRLLIRFDSVLSTHYNHQIATISLQDLTVTLQPQTVKLIKDFVNIDTIPDRRSSLSSANVNQLPVGNLVNALLLIKDLSVNIEAKTTTSADQDSSKPRPDELFLFVPRSLIIFDEKKKLSVLSPSSTTETILDNIMKEHAKIHTRKFESSQFVQSFFEQPQQSRQTSSGSSSAMNLSERERLLREISDLKKENFMMKEKMYKKI